MIKNIFLTITSLTILFITVLGVASYLDYVDIDHYLSAFTYNVDPALGQKAIFEKNRNKIVPIVDELREVTDATGVYVMMYHDKNNKLTVEEGFVLSMFYEAVGPIYPSQIENMQNIPPDFIPDVKRKLLFNCIGFELGNEVDHEIFDFMETRWNIGCPLYHGNKRIGFLGASIPKSYVDPDDFSEYINDINMAARKISKILSSEDLNIY